MSGDYSRDSFDALRDFAGVFLQQGRPVLDADWNEMTQIFERRIRAGTVDTIGRAVVPRETPLGFEVRLIGDDVFIGRGRKYLDGLLLECRGDVTSAVFDRAREGEDGLEGVLDELISEEAGDFLPFLEQPYWPNAALPEITDQPAAIYAVAWKRMVTPTEAPELLDPALGGLDTTCRWQTVWQVRALENVGEGVTCATPEEEMEGWAALVAPSTARLTTGTVDVETPEDPCLVPPTEGYAGVENQFYRVELHGLGNPDEITNPPGQGDWRFKFSRENASVRAAVTSIAADRGSVNVSRIGRDVILKFAPGDWVEITDDPRELDHRSGQMLRVEDVDPETRLITFAGSVDPIYVPGPGETTASRHTRLIRWDQRGIIRLNDGANTEWVNLNEEGSDGLIPVPPGDEELLLESGIIVSFSRAEGAGDFREMDHWRFAARTANTEIEILNAAPPDGIQRHYCRLGVAVPGEDEIRDCRTFWPPLFEAGEGCACTVCVTAEGHNSGELTIQDAIDQVGPAGGTVCLEAGIYELSAPVIIEDRAALTIEGQGIGTLLAYAGAGGAIRITGSTDIQLQRFSVITTANATDPNGGSIPGHGIAALNTSLLALRRLAVLVIAASPEDSTHFAIALDGVQIGTKIEECVAIGPHALGARSSYGEDADGDLQLAAFAELRVADCILFGARVTLRFDRSAINLAAAIFTRNLIFALETGAIINWAETPGASLAVEASSVLAERAGLVLSAGTVRVQDCEINAGEGEVDGIFLAPNVLPEALTDAQIIGNTIFDLGGAGIRVAGRHDTVLIKRNIIRDTGQAGIAVAADATIRHIAIDNNAVERIGLASGFGNARGIALAAAETGQIIGNSVRAVGEAGFNGQVYVGISVAGSGSVDVSANVISEIGGIVETESYGIFVEPPYLGVHVHDNRIFGDLGSNAEPVNWQALRIGGPLGGADPDSGIPPVFTGGVASLPSAAGGGVLGHVVVGEDVFRISPRVFAIALPNLPAQVTAKGNQMRSGRVLLRPMAQVVDGGASALALADNQIDHSGGGVVRSLALVSGPRISAANNMIRHNSDNVSMELFAPRGAAVVIGNVTSSDIELNRRSLGAPFDALNVRG